MGNVVSMLTSRKAKLAWITSLLLLIPGAPSYQKISKDIADKAEAEERTQFTPDEEAHMDGILAEFCRALIVQKSSDEGAGDWKFGIAAAMAINRVIEISSLRMAIFDCACFDFTLYL